MSVKQSTERVKMHHNSLEQAIRDRSFIGGEIEVQEQGRIYRGPIKAIEITGKSVYFYLLWCAHRDFATEKWIVVKNETGAVLNKSITTLTCETDGRLTLYGPDIITGNIFPKDGNKLDPAEVEGLDLNNLPKPVIVNYR